MALTSTKNPSGKFELLNIIHLNRYWANQGYRLCGDVLKFMDYLSC